MKTFEEFLEEARELRKISTPKKSGTMPIPGSEGKARKDVAVAGFRRKGPIQEPKVEKSGKDVPVWVRSHKSPAEYAAHTSRKNYKEGERTDVKSLRKQLRKTGAKKNTEVHDITVGSPKSKVKEPGQRARQFVGALKDVASKMKEKKGIATNTPTAISSSGKKRKRSDEEGAEQRGRIYKKLGMGERDTKTGVQMAKLKDSFDGKTFGEFLDICEGFKPMNEPKMKNQMKKHLARDNAKREGGGKFDNRFGNMSTALKVIGPQQKSREFKEKKTEKSKKTFAKQNADKFLRKDSWHGAKDRLGYKLTVPGRHISRDEEGSKKHVERLKKKEN